MLCGICCWLLSLAIFYEVVICKVECECLCYEFISCGLFDARLALLYDPLSSIMCVVVTFVSLCILIYSCSYMIGDPHFIRFMTYLHLFTLAMLILITADNYVQLFIGWELVGCASYLLISFWFTRQQASKSSVQAMLINRMGDVALALGIICLYFGFKTTNYKILYACVGSGLNYECETRLDVCGLIPICTQIQCYIPIDLCGNMNLIDVACLLMLIGSAGKSGQFGLHSWLPNAMNAPTPVSALLHAATMVTAGIFLIARTSPIMEFSVIASQTALILGVITSLYAGIVGSFQNDLKGIIAYSTCSQLGYMMATTGLHGYNLAMFHLVNHSFFKALLFLASGILIHAFSNQQDIRRYSGTIYLFGLCYCCFLIGNLALIGTPFLTGWFSKDVILETSHAIYAYPANFVIVILNLSVVCSGFYSFKLLFTLFFFRTNVNKQCLRQAYDADFISSLVVIMFALGSIFAGWFYKDIFIALGTDTWNTSTLVLAQHSRAVESEFLPQVIKLLPLLITIIGSITAYIYTSTTIHNTIHNAYTIHRTAVNHYYTYIQPIYYTFIKCYQACTHKLYFDKLVHLTFAMPTYILGLSFNTIFDKGLLELLPVFGVSLPKNIRKASYYMAQTQSGYITHYAMIMVLTALICCTLLSSNLTFIIDL